MEKFVAALGISHRPLPLQQLVIRGTLPCSRDYHSCWRFLHYSCLEQRIARHSAPAVLNPRAARIFLTSASDSEDKTAEDSPVSATIMTTFTLKKKCEFGQGFAVVGADPLLGSWDPAAALPMEWSEDHVWKCQIDLHLGEEYEYKFLMVTSDEAPVWQPGPNRVFKVENITSPLVISEDWDATEPNLPVQKEAAESVSELVEEILNEQWVEDVPALINETADVVENVLETAGINVAKVVEDVLEEAAAPGDEENGTVKEEEEEVPGAGEESESADKDEDVLQPSENAAGTGVVASLEEDTKSSSESGSESDSESSDESEEDISTVHEQDVSPKPASTVDITEDSKGFKNFKFESNPSTAMNQ